MGARNLAKEVGGVNREEKDRLLKKIKRDIRILSALEVVCERCAECTSSLERFCTWCGAENPAFSLEEFTDYHHEPFERVMGRNCRDNHIEEKEAIFEVAFPFNPGFCPFCGAPFPAVPTQEVQGTH
ncbi:MAG: hypothetical protein HY435_00210 [Candidatus Liptonbacteria bacterium]|nr:hypothetical protein [Candidatus Liptonbacteria bacterium]